METKGLKDRLGTVGSQFAVTQIMAFIMSLPLLYLTRAKWGEFRETRPRTVWSRTTALLAFFANESDMTIKKTPITRPSRTRRAVIVIIGVALVMGEAL